jgi:putative sigma-54 modulation protein
MQVSYTGIHQELPPKIQSKLDAKFSKLSKLLDSRGEHKAHVVVSHQKRSFRAEVTVQFYDRQFVGIGTHTDLFTALSAALEKLDTQAVKQRGKWRETHRRNGSSPAPAPASAPEPADSKRKRVFRTGAGSRKPITLEEAMLEVEKDRDYLAYRDAESERIHVLIRRRDGHFDLIES